MTSLIAPMRSVLLMAILLPCVGSGCDSSAASPATSGPAPAAAKGTVHVEEAPGDGQVDAIVRDALATAERDHRRVVVYVGAPWCEPCTRFHKAAQVGDLDGLFPDVDLLAFDATRDEGRLAAAGYRWTKYIPLFALPSNDGRASGKQFEGGIKGEGAVSYLAPRLQALLRE